MKSERIYLYDTMRIVRPSNKEYVNVEIESFLMDKALSILHVVIYVLLVHLCCQSAHPLRCTFLVSAASEICLLRLSEHFQRLL